MEGFQSVQACLLSQASASVVVGCGDGNNHSDDGKRSSEEGEQGECTIPGNPLGYIALVTIAY